MKTTFLSMAMIISLIFLTPKCDLLPTEIELDEDGRYETELVDVVITLGFWEDYTWITNWNAGMAHVTIGHRVYGAAEKWDILFSEDVKGTKSSNNTREGRIRLIEGDEYYITVKVGENSRTEYYGS